MTDAELLAEFCKYFLLEKITVTPLLLLLLLLLLFHHYFSGPNIFTRKIYNSALPVFFIDEHVKTQVYKSQSETAKISNTEPRSYICNNLRLHHNFKNGEISQCTSDALTSTEVIHLNTPVFRRDLWKWHQPLHHAPVCPTPP